MSLNVRIITPEKVFLTSETEQVVLPSITGGIGILAGHAPLVTILEAGVLRYKNNGSWTPTVLYGGFAEVENNQVTVLVNGAEEVASSSSIEEVEKALVDATANLEKVKETISEDRKLKPEILKVQIAKARFEAVKMLKG
jgi:F-type H+-transporting ATPase subunit epsilon